MRTFLNSRKHSQPAPLNGPLKNVSNIELPAEVSKLLIHLFYRTPVRLRFLIMAAVRPELDYEACLPFIQGLDEINKGVPVPFLTGPWFG